MLACTGIQHTGSRVPTWKARDDSSSRTLPHMPPGCPEVLASSWLRARSSLAACRVGCSRCQCQQQPVPHMFTLLCCMYLLKAECNKG